MSRTALSFPARTRALALRCSLAAISITAPAATSSDGTLMDRRIEETKGELAPAVPWPLLLPRAPLPPPRHDLPLREDTCMEAAAGPTARPGPTPLACLLLPDDAADDSASPTDLACLFMPPLLRLVLLPPLLLLPLDVVRLRLRCSLLDAGALVPWVLPSSAGTGNLLRKRGEPGREGGDTGVSGDTVLPSPSCRSWS